MVWLVIGIITVIYGVFSVFASLRFIGTSLSDFIVLFIFGSIFITLGILSFRKYKKIKEIKSKLNPEQEGVFGKFKHTIGLNLPENTMCILHLYLQGITINANGVTFNIPRDRILNISVKTDEEIQKQLVSNAGGAIAGGIMFGPLGAMIGGRPKEKKIITHKQYLIFIYEKDGKPEYIAFDTTNNTDYIKFNTYFQDYMHKDNMQVNL